MLHLSPSQLHSCTFSTISVYNELHVLFCCVRKQTSLIDLLYALLLARQPTFVVGLAYLLDNLQQNLKPNNLHRCWRTR